MKKILAIAIASAFAAPAMAATSNVDVYGTFSMSVDSLTNGSGRALNVSSNSSNIGFKGAEDLGGGMSAIWQLETTLGLDGAGSWGGQRDSFVGVKSGFGTIRLGYFDTPMKEVARKMDLFNNKIGDTRNLTGGATTNWDARFNNGIRYDSPEFAGFSGSAHYSTQHTGATNAGSTESSADAYSLGLNYKNGPIAAMWGYQKGNITATTDETAWRLGVGANLGDFAITAMYHTASDTAGTSGADRKVYGLGGAYKMGNIKLSAQWYKATDLKGNATADQSADMYALGADYSLSKRTTAYVAYAKANNDANGNFRVSAGGHGDGLAVAANGLDPSGISLGLIHKF